MNLNENEIEKLLRSAPHPAPPAGLKQQLSSQVNLPKAKPATQTPRNFPRPESWLRRWWPVLVPATASLLCAVALAVQQAELRRLRSSINAHSQSATTIISTAPQPPAIAPAPADATPSDSGEPQEIARLNARLQQLTEEIAQLEQVQKENAALREKLAAAPTLTPEETDALTKAKERAQSIQCINNLKQFGLAVRIWAVDNNDVFPPDTLSMSNELNTPKILVCPAETNRVAAKNWGGFTSANLSYEYLTPSATNADSEPSRVLTRCPIHGHVGLCDGSVQSSVGKNHPDWLIERDGKLYMETSPRPEPPASNR